jgi:hexokinase
MALEFVNHSNVSVTVEELQRITDVFVECCLRPMDNDLKERVKKLDKWILDKKTEQDAKK